MGTLEAIVMILSYVKHNPGATALDLILFLKPHYIYKAESDLEFANKVAGLAQGLVEDELLSSVEGNTIGDWKTYYLGPAIPRWGWGFQANIDPRQISNTHIQYQSVHLPTNTEPGVQTQMLFNRSQARQQLMQLIGALL